MQDGKLKNFCKAAFNAINFSALGAIPLSHGIGSEYGTALFGTAIVAGTFNKYKSLNTESQGHTWQNANDSWLIQQFKSPSLTAKILMLAAGYNCGDAVYDMATQGPDKMAENGFRAAAWLCGVIGDYKFTKIENLNFAALTSHTKSTASKLRASFHAATANPVLFYNGAGIGLAGAMLATTPLNTPPAYIGMAITAAYGLSIAYAMRRSWQAATGAIAIKEINNGLINFTAAAAGVGQSIFAASTGKYAVATAMAMFSGVAVKTLYETRSALKKERSSTHNFDITK
ncbi:MAG: hypothetical protein H6867_08270 [Rhodospirillales bacterium]|nr:hypothetical protein [Rhodospirillales bacterium]MCB9995552.1 hypothetical protein [Rhodospirillales bacterium]